MGQKSLTLTLETLLAETPAKEVRLCEKLQHRNQIWTHSSARRIKTRRRARHIPQNRQIHLYG